jgi:HlyD family secretion protein
MKYPASIFSFILLLTACKPGAGDAVRYQTAAVSRGDLRAFVTATGTLSAVISVDVGSQLSGQIVRLNADFNSLVKKGDVIAEIDTALYAASVKEATGELAAAVAEATLKKQVLERTRQLVPTRAATEADLELAVSDLARAEATVMIKEAALARANADLGYCIITAPVDGVVISRKVDPGQTLAAAMTTPVLFTIAQDIRKMNISASVSEADIGRVKVGNQVDFTVDAFPDDLFVGTVKQVRMAATTKENVVTYETLIEVDNRDQKLFPGMTADVSILVAEHSGVLKIPNTALRFTPPEDAAVTSSISAKLQRGQQLVYLAKALPNVLEAVVVTTGITNNTETEILTGLTEDARVVTAATGLVKASLFGDGPSDD